jgi:hypothetical protein
MEGISKTYAVYKGATMNYGALCNTKKGLLYYCPEQDDLILAEGRKGARVSRLKVVVHVGKKKLSAWTLPGLYYYIGKFD